MGLVRPKNWEIALSKTHKQKFTRNKLQIKDKFDALDALLVFLEVPIYISTCCEILIFYTNSELCFRKHLTTFVFTPISQKSDL